MLDWIGVPRPLALDALLLVSEVVSSSVQHARLGADQLI